MTCRFISITINHVAQRYRRPLLICQPRNMKIAPIRIPFTINVNLNIDRNELVLRERRTYEQRRRLLLHERYCGPYSLRPSTLAVRTSVFSKAIKRIDRQILFPNKAFTIDVDTVSIRMNRKNDQNNETNQHRRQNQAIMGSQRDCNGNNQVSADDEDDDIHSVSSSSSSSLSVSRRSSTSSSSSNISNLSINTSSSSTTLSIYSRRISSDSNYVSG